ncbi:MAG: restriction endonuclease subunit S, partial [Anaerolineae bacterium]|nr:restriction endonuclease subunit S [Anaerolineae bacterium]
MSLDLLFPNFDELIRTPEDVQRLNETILQLAVQGKLVPQDPNDEPASELLKRIAGEKRRLVQEKKIRKSKQLPPIKPPEVPWDLPRGWCWSRLGDVILEIQTGPFGSMLHKSDYVEGGVPVVNPANIRDGRIVLLANMAVSEDTVKRLERYVLEQGDIVMGRRGEMGRCAVVTESEAGWLCGSGSFNLKTSHNMAQEYLVRLIRSPDARSYLSGGSVGSTMNNLNHRILNRMVIGVPPVAEQQRIVAKVDELFAQTRALEAKLRQAQERVVTFNRAALHRMHTAQDDAQFQTSWRTVSDHFDVLYDDPRNVAELRQAILDLAVRGKLAPQDPNDEPAEELLKNIGGGKRTENGRKKS